MIYIEILIVCGQELKLQSQAPDKNIYLVLE